MGATSRPLSDTHAIYSGRAVNSYNGRWPGTPALPKNLAGRTGNWPPSAHQWASILSKPGISKKTNFIIAAYIGKEDIVKKFLKGKVCPDDTDEEGTSALCWAVIQNHPNTIDIILKAGAAVDKSDQDGTTPLQHAALKGSAELVTRLLAAGASQEISDCSGRRAVHYAAEGGDTATFMALLKQTGRNANPDIGLLQDNNGVSPLEIAVRGGHAGIVILIWGKERYMPIKESNVLVLSATMNGHKHIVDMFIAMGVDCAILADPLAFWLSARNGREGLIKLQLKHGADPNAGNPEYEEFAEEDGNSSEPSSPLDIAVCRGYYGTAGILRSAGALYSVQYLSHIKDKLQSKDHYLNTIKCSRCRYEVNRNWEYPVD